MRISVLDWICGYIPNHGGEQERNIPGTRVACGTETAANAECWLRRAHKARPSPLTLSVSVSSHVLMMVKFAQLGRV